jgi:hypothetical protein
MRALRTPFASQMYRAVCLVLLLIAGQQGALVHELGHLSSVHSPEPSVDSQHPAEPVCALCSSFAQAASPAFGYSLPFLPLPAATADRIVARIAGIIDVSVPTPRSRGPPSLS